MSNFDELKREIAELKDMLKTLTHSKELSAQYTLYEFMDIWYKTYKADLSLSAKNGILNCFRHIKKGLSDKPLKNYTAFELDSFLVTVETSRMRLYCYNTLRDMFRTAYKLNFVYEDLSQKMKKVTHEYEEGSALTVEQRKILIRKAKKDKYGNIILFYLYTGCRLKGALFLKWEQVKFDKNLIYINETKTKNSVRHVPLLPVLEDLLQSIEKKTDNVFTFSESTLKRTVVRLKKACGFNLRIKDLRTTYATILAENSISKLASRKWLGHGSSQTTEKFYEKLLSEHEKSEAKKLDKAFKTLC